MKAKFSWSKLAGALALLCGLMMAVSCEKIEHSFFFSSLGGPYEFDMELDGSTLMVSDDSGSSNKAVFYGSEADMEHSNWVAELDWIHVFYLPTSQHVHVLVLENKTGAARKARVSAERSGKRIVIAEFKQQ